MYKANPERLKERLSNVYWIGGGSGAGKSTIARQIAQQHGMVLYDSDAAMLSHIQRCNAQGSQGIGIELA